MGIIDDFDLLLAKFNRVEEWVFLGEIADFAAKHKDVVIRTFGLLIKEKKLNIQLRYLVLKSMGNLKFLEFIPMLRESLRREKKVQLIYTAVDSLVRINTLESYKVIIYLLQSRHNDDYRAHVEDSLKTFFNTNKVIFHFDVFYRDRGDVKGIDRSADFLIKYLPEDYVKDLLPAIGSHHEVIRREVLRVFKSKPNAAYYSALYNSFRDSAEKCDDVTFLLLAETLIVNASISRAAGQIFERLKEHASVLSGGKRIIFSILLLRMNTPEMIDEVIRFYHKLTLDGKLLIYENIQREAHDKYIAFLRELLKEEDHEAALAKIIEILIYARDFHYFFSVVKDARPARRGKLLDIMLEFDPPGIDSYLKKYVYPDQDDHVLRLALEYILRHTADEYYELIRDLFFAGVSVGVKSLIIRNFNRVAAINRKQFLEQIFEDIAVIMPFKKDFLFSLVVTLNEKFLDRPFEEKVLNRVLVMLEEAGLEEIVNFIYFFDKYEVARAEDVNLIFDEFHMIQNTILKSDAPDADDLVRMIHTLIKNIEKRVRQKGIKI